MITRSFLFLLAMITGFSAAHAADSVRQTPEMVGSALTVAHAAAVLWSADAAVAETRGLPLFEKFAPRRTIFQPIPTSAKLPIAATIFVGDRNRQ
jgi:hypothetical protein